MFCNNCKSPVSEVGYDIYVSDEQELIEERQFQCYKCGQFSCMHVIDGRKVEYNGVHTKEVECAS